jgi:hypothetical protein
MPSIEMRNFIARQSDRKRFGRRQSYRFRSRAISCDRFQIAAGVGVRTFKAALSSVPLMYGVDKWNVAGIASTVRYLKLDLPVASRHC